MFYRAINDEKYSHTAVFLFIVCNKVYFKNQAAQLSDDFLHSAYNVRNCVRVGKIISARKTFP